MVSIVRLAAPPLADGDRWADIGAHIATWLATHGVAARDAIVLLPFAQLLAPARRAFALRGGFMPRIETTRTLARSLGPPPATVADAPSLDPAVDAVVARQMLAQQTWGAQWRRRDRHGFDRGAVRLVESAHAIVRAAADVAPPARDGWWAAVRDSLAPSAGPGGRERALARIAVEWAALAGPAPTDRLFALQPAAWVAVQGAGQDHMVAALLAASGAPCLVVDTDGADDGLPAGVWSERTQAFAVCAGFEQEAEAAAAQVLAHLGRGERPVALIAVDRIVVRRVRALLERSGASLLDETGWKLSTTRAAAGVMALLTAAQRNATSDQLFEWLKSGSFAASGKAALGVAALEAICRKRSIWRIDALAELVLDHDHDDAESTRREALGRLARLQAGRPRPIAAWLQTLSHLLADAGVLAALQADEAGRQVISSLGLDATQGDARARFVAAGEPVALAEFTQWVDEALEQATFRPAGAGAAADGAEVDVVITPLARAMLRPFAAAVLPGADDRSLGAFHAPESLLSSATRAALGVAGPADRLHAEWLAFGHLLALPQVTLLHRRADGVEPLATSRFVERLSLALAGRGRTLREWTEPGLERSITAQPVRRSAASAAARVPARLSATSFEILRACPYRFFATRMLGAAEDAELDGDLEKRDYGSWLHQVLHAFHAARPQPTSAGGADEAGLRAAAASVLGTSGFDAAEFLPWGAAFDAFVPRYVTWLRDREARGARWMRGEASFSVRPSALGGVELAGVIDRIDEVDGDDGATLELIDYKTGSAEALKERVRDRFEDTQLAFYAALVAPEGQAVKATYLALEARPALQEIEHRDVAVSAAALIEGVAVDLSRLRTGAGMMPLGEGAACRFCEARGLCRRDHWSDAEDEAPG